MTGLPEDIVKVLVHQQYFVHGNHSAVKLCTYTKKSLKREAVCYKQRFYGIESHRCLQMTPAVAWCTHRCQFCWRSESWAMGNEMNNVKIDDPEDIVLGLVFGQRKLLSGFGGHPKVPREKWEEALYPKHVAISLAGEPTLYPRLGELIQEFHDYGMTTFLVTNGSRPDVLETLDPLPTQLYVTVPAPDEITFKKTVRPFDTKNGWKRLMATLDLLPSLNTRKVIRLTLVKGLNMHSPDKYSELFLRSGAHFLEAKGFSSVGSAHAHLGFDRMPSYEEIMSFSEQIIGGTELKIIDSTPIGTVSLMAKEDFPWRRKLVFPKAKKELPPPYSRVK